MCFAPRPRSRVVNSRWRFEGTAAFSSQRKPRQEPRVVEGRQAPADRRQHQRLVAARVPRRRQVRHFVGHLPTPRPCKIPGTQQPQHCAPKQPARRYSESPWRTRQKHVFILSWGRLCVDGKSHCGQRSNKVKHASRREENLRCGQEATQASVYVPTHGAVRLSLVTHTSVNTGALLSGRPYPPPFPRVSQQLISTRCPSARTGAGRPRLTGEWGLFPLGGEVHRPSSSTNPKGADLTVTARDRGSHR